MKRLLAITLGVALAGVGTVALAGRSTSGTYSLPAGNPVVSGTSISASWANNSLGDIATALSDSLSRQGYGPMLAPLRIPDGTVAAPTLAFTSEPGSGVYRAGASDVRMSVAGTDRAKWTAGGFFADVRTALTATSATIKGAVADGASAVGVILDNTIALADAGAKLVSFRSNGVEKASISAAGDVTATGKHVAAGGFDATAGNVVLSNAGTQAILKSAGILQIGGDTGNTSQLQFLVNGALRGWFSEAGMDLEGGILTRVATPTAATDAATKGYVDARPSPFAWARILTGAAGVATVVSGSGVASSGYSGNDLAVTFSAVQPDANYACIVSGGPIGASAPSLAMNPATSSTTVLHIGQSNEASGALNYSSGYVYSVVCFR